MASPILNPNFRNIPFHLLAKAPFIDTDNLEVTAQGRFQQACHLIRSQAKAWDELVKRSDRAGRNPYHNIDHIETVERRCQKVAACDQLPVAKHQALVLAAFGHDLCHPGVGDRKAVPADRPLIFPELGASITNETASASACYELMRQAGVSEDVMIVSLGAIESTTFVGKDPGGHNSVEDILRACDIAVDYDDPADWVRESTRVLQESDPATRTPLQQWLKGREWFLANWVRPRMLRVRATMQLWGDCLVKTEDYIGAALKGDERTLKEIGDIVAGFLPRE